MSAAPSQDWNVFQPIFVEPWDGFKRVYPRYQTPYYDDLVDKRLRCGHPDQMGSIAYRCLPCGQGPHRVAMSCQSSRCLRCAQVDVDTWVSQVSRMLHEGGISRHRVLTVPAIVRQTFYRQSHAVLSPCMRGGVRCVADVFRRVSGKPRQGGDIVVLQPHGRHGQDNPHLHIIATRGGWDQQASPWGHLDYIPYPLLRKQGQWYRLTMLRQTVKTPESKRFVDACYPRYREGCVTNVHKGDVPSRSQSLATYLAQQVVSPPISLRRIDRYDGHRVTYHYRSHQSEQVERETVEVSTFIGRMVQHTFPKGCQRIRSDGGQATKTFEKSKVLIQAAWAQVKGVVKGASKIIAAMTYRQRSQQSPGRDPVRCPYCQRAMGVWRIWHPKYGVIYDELEAIRRGKYASQAIRADPTNRPGRTLWPTAGGVSLARCSLRCRDTGQ